MLCMAVAVMGGLASCEEHTDEYDGSLKVGNILLADNSIVSPQGYDSKNQTAVGVIFYASRDTALVVSRYELGSYAYADSLGTVGSVNSDSRILPPCWFQRFQLLQPKQLLISAHQWQAGLCPLPVN